MIVSSPFIDAYEVLGVRPTASQAELKAAHRALVRAHHPDLVAPEERAAATRRVQQINVAYGLVRAPEQRASYDRLRAQALARQRLGQAAGSAGDAVAGFDQAAARRWEQAVSAAGRWAGRWWRRHRSRAGVAALRVRRGAADLLGRILWLVTCAAWAGFGAVLALAAQRLLDVTGPIAPVAAVLAGAALGSRRGWRRRLRLARLPGGVIHVGVAAAELAAALAVLGLGLGLDSRWG